MIIGERFDLLLTFEQRYFILIRSYYTKIFLQEYLNSSEPQDYHKNRGFEPSIILI